jgi:hypothetical protein
MVPISDASFSHLRLRVWGAQAFRCPVCHALPAAAPPAVARPSLFQFLVTNSFSHSSGDIGLVNDTQSKWAARARQSLKFCEMQMHLSAASVQP